MTERGDELGRAMGELLEQARRAGVAGELRPVLEEWLRTTRPVARAGKEAGARFGMVGSSAKMRAVYDLIERVAPADVPVLVLGETGTGKELVARALHDASRRRNRTFLAENCAAVPASLLESELFGHKRGSFTGAVVDRDGHFVAADGGTLFLDEIGDMPLDMQVKLLRVLETGEVRPVGGNTTVRVDVRVVAATHRDLEAMVRRRAFREDLYYRLAVMRIELPPLRERPEDVEPLVRLFLELAARDDGVEPRALTEAALDALKGAPWPGNVRQLENEIRRASVLAKGTIDVGDLSPALVARD